jgi:SAM-dependent methyltransferase
LTVTAGTANPSRFAGNVVNCGGLTGMEIHRHYGVVAPDKGWVPTPTYLLRRSAIFDALEGRPPGRVLEVGCSAGALLYDLAERGYTGVGVELSAKARSIARQVLAGDKGFSIESEVPEGPAQSFDLLIAFEVLEHIEDDAGALAAWLELLKPGGQLLISVPAHRRRWNVTDVLVGHYRRYDRTDVEALLRGAGLTIDKVSTIGWPASWLIERARIFAKTIQMRTAGVDVEAIARGDSARTQDSGIDRSLETRFFPLYANPAGRLLVRGAAKIQRRFYDTELGISYLAAATKPGRP